MYTIWIKIDKTFPWVELKGEFESRSAAKQAAQIAVSRIAVKLVNVPTETRAVDSLVTVRSRR